MYLKKILHCFYLNFKYFAVCELCQLYYINYFKCCYIFYILNSFNLIDIYKHINIIFNSAKQNKKTLINIQKNCLYIYIYIKSI